MDAVSLIPGDGPLQADAQADVCIIGAGLAGLTTGYLLAHEGRSVIILDDGKPGMGETLRTTAHLTAALDDRIFAIAKRHGAAKARLAVQSQVAAIDRIERICQEEHLAGIFRRVDGFLFLNPKDDPSILEDELKAANAAGLDARIEPSAPLPFATGPALVFPHQAELDAGEYLAGLADGLRRMGGRIHGGTHATELDEGPPLAVRTAKGRVECEAVVVCTDAPVFGKLPLHTKQEQCRTYVVAYEVPSQSIPRGLYWDTWEEGHGYHYIRLADRAGPGKDLLLVGGEDHRTGEGDPKECLDRLEAWAEEHFPVGEPRQRWSGQVVEPVDHLPFIGRFPGKGSHVFVITGDSGQGFTNHTCGAMLVTDLIQNRRNPWTGLYSPARQGLGGLLDRLRANAQGALKAKSEAGGSPDPRLEDAIPPGSGAVIRRNGAAVACYREPSGELRECAAACPHMGATLRWNDLEKTWDCPWHGSRFKAAGQVVDGPANRPLERVGHEDIPMKPTKTPKGGSRSRRTQRRTHRTSDPTPRTAQHSRPDVAGARGHAGDAIAILKADHRKVKRLLKQLDEAGQGAERQRLFDAIERELLVHARLEEELFYPAFKRAVGDDAEDKRMYFEAHEEHEIAERMAAEMRGHRDPGSDEYAAKGKVLKDLIEHHIREEEKDMFPVARKHIGRDRLRRLGDHMRGRKAQMLAGDVADLRRIAAPRDAIVPGSEALDGSGDGAWQRMRRTE